MDMGGTKGSMAGMPPAEEQARTTEQILRRIEAQLTQPLEPLENPTEPVKPDAYPKIDLDGACNVAVPVEKGRDIDVE